ncbi:GtrA family protein [Saccharibacillus sp. CPCC 101409]|uniref:GtrA family protein n=1 Tax=Saccharibacillus sp. CPCC 101409 TaxID=3058041 RepID=UPI0026716C70|nr:GtrA family protein [Saccharibacillus sp. CPCC 101409]MDO3412757.1 GtrA family protein [Saccharibacillus sp. CPCC 101409]
MNSPEERRGPDLASSARRPIRFAIVGVSNTLVDFIVFFLLQGLIGPFAQAAGYAAGTANSYYWNRRWTFKTDQPRQKGELGRFLVVNLTVALLTSVLLALLNLFLPVWMSKVLVTVPGMALNYILSKVWVFRPAAAEKPNL